MISDLDIYRAANLVIKRHGSDAVIEAARMTDRMLELGDLEGHGMWRPRHVAAHPARYRSVANTGDCEFALARGNAALMQPLWYDLRYRDGLNALAAKPQQRRRNRRHQQRGHFQRSYFSFLLSLFIPLVRAHQNTQIAQPSIQSVYHIISVVFFPGCMLPAQIIGEAWLVCAIQKPCLCGLTHIRFNP